jgi:surface protein
MAKRFGKTKVKLTKKELEKINAAFSSRAVVAKLAKKKKKKKKKTTRAGGGSRRREVVAFGGQAYGYALTSMTDPTSSSWTTKPAGYTYYPGEGIGADAPITNMRNMFLNATTFNEDISSWDVTKVINFESLFSGATAFNNGGAALSWTTTGPLTETSAMTSLYGTSYTNYPNTDSYDDPYVFAFMFSGATSFNQDISTITPYGYVEEMMGNTPAFNNGGVPLTWDMQYVTCAEEMFSQLGVSAGIFNAAGVGSWNMSNVQNLGYFFTNQGAFNQDIGGWNVANVQFMYDLFEDCTSFNQDISSWDVSSVTNMIQMFDGASAFDQNLNAWYVPNIASLPTNFAAGATLFTTDEFPYFGGILYPLSNTATDPTLSIWRTANPTYQFIANVGILMPAGSPITNMTRMFVNSTFNDPDISTWDVSTVTSMFNMFSSASAFNQDVSSWNVSNVLEMQYMFRDADAFNNGGVALNWGNKTANVTNMSNMFNNADVFNQDISGWNVSSVINATGFSINAGQKGTLAANWQEAEHPSNVGLGNFYNL